MSRGTHTAFGTGTSGGRPMELARPSIEREADGGATMLAWERFLTGDPRGAAAAPHVVVSSWQRSLALGVDPARNAAPMAASGDAVTALRRDHRELITAARSIFDAARSLLSDSGSLMLLTNPDGVVLEVVGDTRTVDEGKSINLMQGGDWRERVVGTNGIGTAIATGAPAQVHASEHFCEGIKAWTCAAAPIHEPGTGALLGVVDISGPPSTYQRNNLTLAVATARQIEAVLAQVASSERSLLLEVCLRRLSSADAAGLVAIDRSGRLVHATGRIPAPVALGERLPGFGARTTVEDWAGRLPEGWRPEWFSPVAHEGRTIGALLVVPPGATPLVGGSRTSERANSDRQVERSSEADPRRASFDAIVGQSPVMLAALARARQLSTRRVSVLIEGETGTGKELMARAIHGASGDKGRPFIAFNCGAVSRELVAGELFGHVRGAYTGATAEGRAGRFELAHRGMICLDEIGEMPLDLQPVLLRVLEEGVVYRLGDTQPRPVDVRLVAMTNRNLRDEVEAGRFRRDLYYRISVTMVRVPPLRERVGDVERLVAHFSQILAARHSVLARRMRPDVMACLLDYHWPGNVRELRNLVESALLTAEGTEITLEDIPPEVVLGDLAAGEKVLAEGGGPTILRAEREAIRRALANSEGNLSAASRVLGISRSTLYRKLVRFGMHV